MYVCVFQVEAGERGRQKVNNHNIFPVAPSAALNCTAFKWVMKELIYGHYYLDLTHVSIECWEIVLIFFQMKAKMMSKINLQNLHVILVLSRL